MVHYHFADCLDFCKMGWAKFGVGTLGNNGAVFVVNRYRPACRIGNGACAPGHRTTYLSWSSPSEKVTCPDCLVMRDTLEETPAKNPLMVVLVMLNYFRTDNVGSYRKVDV